MPLRRPAASHAREREGRAGVDLAEHVRVLADGIFGPRGSPRPRSRVATGLEPEEALHLRTQSDSIRVRSRWYAWSRRLEPLRRGGAARRRQQPRGYWCAKPTTWSWSGRRGSSLRRGAPGTAARPSARCRRSTASSGRGTRRAAMHSAARRRAACWTRSRSSPTAVELDLPDALAAHATVLLQHERCAVGESSRQLARAARRRSGRGGCRCPSSVAACRRAPVSCPASGSRPGAR